MLDAVRRIVQTLRESSRAAEKAVGLSGAQLFVLQTLAEAPGLSLNELAARTHTHQSSVSTVVVAAGRARAGAARRRRPATRAALELRLSAAGAPAVGRAPRRRAGRG